MGMKLGSETGSVTNWLMSSTAPKTPVVGEGATEILWTDRRAFTVISVDGKKCTIQEDNAKPLFQGMTDAQSYEYTPNPEGWKRELVFKWGAWRERNSVGRYPKVNIIFGVRQKYHDYSF